MEHPARAAGSLRPMRRGPTRCACLLLAVLAVALSASLPETAPAAPLGQEGRWLTDARDRVRILHGVNMVYKVPPYYPRAAGFDRADARFLRRHGFNTVRLGVIYRRVEPRPGWFDDGYLDQVARTERVLARERIFSLLDFHQDLYNERFQGEGFPNWAVDTDGLPPQPQAGFPANYLLMPALNRAFDHFWANDPAPDGVGLQDHYARAWRKVARRFRASDRVLGYDLFNEPWPGSVYPSCANPVGCPRFDTGPLARMSRKSTRAIRKVDRRHIVFAEPQVIFNQGADSHLPDFGRGPTGFSFHVYCLTVLNTPVFAGDPTRGASCEGFDELVFDNAEKQARETGQALILSEFGATNDRPTLERVLRLADGHRVSWQYWHYCECDDPTTAGSGVQGVVFDARKPPRGANVNHAKLDLLERAYPQAVAGTPTRYSWNERRATFRLRYAARKVGGGFFSRGTTRVYLPDADYPRGYEVAASGARVTSPPGSRHLTLRKRPAATAVAVTVTPG